MAFLVLFPPSILNQLPLGALAVTLPPPQVPYDPHGPSAKTEYLSSHPSPALSSDTYLPSRLQVPGRVLSFSPGNVTASPPPFSMLSQLQDNSSINFQFNFTCPMCQGLQFQPSSCTFLNGLSVILFSVLGVLLLLFVFFACWFLVSNYLGARSVSCSNYSILIQGSPTISTQSIV